MTSQPSGVIVLGGPLGVAPVAAHHALASGARPCRPRPGRRRPAVGIGESAARCAVRSPDRVGGDLGRIVEPGAGAVGGSRSRSSARSPGSRASPSSRRTSSGGTRAAPVPATRSDDRSVVGEVGWSNISRYWVGTPWATVTRSRSISRSVSPAVHGVGAITVVIRCSSSSHTRVMVPTWAKGSGRDANVVARRDRRAAFGDRPLALVVEHRALGYARWCRSSTRSRPGRSGRRAPADGSDPRAARR